MDDIDSVRESEDDIPDGQGKRSLRQLVTEVIEAQNGVADLEESLAAAKAHLRELETIELPRAMDAVNAGGSVNDFKFNDGIRVKVADDVFGSIPKEEPQRQAALDYLVEQGGGNLFLTDVTVSFKRNEHNMALSFAQELRERGYEVDVSSGVHHMSLAAWARELIRKGEDMDWLRLGLQRFRKAKVTLPKGMVAFKK